MLPNDDLARWGEPPTDDRELAMAELLAEILRHGQEDEPVPQETVLRAGRAGAAGLLDVCRRIDEMMATIAVGAGVLENIPPPADAGGLPRTVELRLSVSRLLAGVWQSIASTHPRPCVVRDMRRVPENPDRVTLRTGDRVRVDVACDRGGHLLVFNVGPGGKVNLLYPERDGEAGIVQEGQPLRLMEVELTPPAGRERLYAVWSRSPLTAAGVQLRDMKRVEERLTALRPEDWHAVVLELDHAS
jgi:hypothetical protein